MQSKDWRITKVEKKEEGIYFVDAAVSYDDVEVMFYYTVHAENAKDALAKVTNVGAENEPKPVT